MIALNRRHNLFCVTSRKHYIIIDLEEVAATDTEKNKPSNEYNLFLLSTVKKYYPRL